VEHVCPGSETPQDRFGDEALCCPSLGKYPRHNAIRDTPADLFVLAGSECRKEVALPESSDQPATWLPNFSNGYSMFQISL
jgi:hypothetical protein